METNLVSIRKLGNYPLWLRLFFKFSICRELCISLLKLMLTVGYADKKTATKCW